MKSSRAKAKKTILADSFEQITEDYSTLLKDMTILTGTMFTTSIALAAGRDVNSFFVFGELFLFLSLISGSLMLWHELMRQRRKVNSLLYKYTPAELLPITFFIPMLVGMVLIWLSLMK